MDASKLTIAQLAIIKRAAYKTAQAARQVLSDPTIKETERRIAINRAKAKIKVPMTARQIGSSMTTLERREIRKNPLSDNEIVMQALRSYHISPTASSVEAYNIILKREKSKLQGLEYITENYFTPKTRKAYEFKDVLKSFKKTFNIYFPNKDIENDLAKSLNPSEYFLLRRCAIADKVGAKVSPRELSLENTCKEVCLEKKYLDFIKYNKDGTKSVKRNTRWKKAIDQLTKDNNLDSNTATILDLFKAIAKTEAERSNSFRINANQLLS